MTSLYCKEKNCTEATYGRTTYCENHKHLTKPIFTTKHYKAIAKILGKNWRQRWARATAEIILGLKADNPKFDIEKFIKELDKS